MCGIYGTTMPYNERQVQEKLERTSFRGPDQMGYESYSYSENGKVSFGHNRLSIIDLDPRSNQPFTYEGIHLVFNGEIYNFNSLRNQLELKGYNFKTTSDTEVICAAYLEFGEECVSLFNGMFAFVIYDPRKHSFFGARDRMGQKPFYFYHNGTDFEFSSQIASIQLFNKNLTISKKAINLFLDWRTIPDPYSIFNEVKKLKAGHCFTFNLNKGGLTIKQYWDIDYNRNTSFEGSFKDAKYKLNELLTDAVKIRLFADVPVGVFLSGGIDSSIISALAQRVSNSKIKTFSVKFNEKGYDESMYAQQVADHLQTDHHVIECNYEEGIDLIDNFSHYYDEPFADSSAIPSMLLAKHTSNKVKVALSGDAGDENFIGYPRYDVIKRTNLAMQMPHVLRIPISKVLRSSGNHRLKIIANILKHADVNAAYLSMMIGAENKEWYKSENSIDIEEYKYLNHKNKGLFERVTDFDLKTYLNWDINTKVDRASMAYSLEARAPLQDYRVVEFARSLPTNYKYHNSSTMKHILKELLYDYVPKPIFNRPKAGFGMPFSQWFKKELKDYVMDELNFESLEAIPLINATGAQKIIAEHLNGQRDHYLSIWSILILKQWLSKNGNGYSIE